MPSHLVNYICLSFIMLIYVFEPNSYLRSRKVRTLSRQSDLASILIYIDFPDEIVILVLLSTEYLVSINGIRGVLKGIESGSRTFVHDTSNGRFPLID